MRISALVLLGSFLLTACGSPPDGAAPTTPAKRDVAIAAPPSPAAPADPSALALVPHPNALCVVAGAGGFDLSGKPGGPTLFSVSRADAKLILGTQGEMFVQTTSPAVVLEGYVAQGPTHEPPHVFAAKWLSFAGVYFPGITDILAVSVHDRKISVAAPEELGFELTDAGRRLDVACDDIALAPDPNGVLRRQPPPQFPTGPGQDVRLHSSKAIGIAATIDGPVVASFSANDAPVTVTVVERHGKKARIRWGHLAVWIDAVTTAPLDKKTRESLQNLTGMGMLGALGGNGRGEHAGAPPPVVCPRDVRLVASMSGDDALYPIGHIPAGKPVYLRSGGGDVSSIWFDSMRDSPEPANGVTLAALNVDLAQCMPSAAPAAARVAANPDDDLARFNLTDAVDALAPEPLQSFDTAEDHGVTGLGVGMGKGGGVTNGDGVGLGNVGSLGHGAGGSTPRIRQGAASINGPMASDAVLRLLRQNFGRFRLCYESGLRTTPTLAGRVITKFTIGKNGNVGAVSDAGSDLADASVVACVDRSIAQIQFPAPASGLVVVVYPMIFGTR